MIIDNQGTTTIITQETATIVELVKKLEVLYDRFKNDNVIVSLSSLNKIPSEHIVEFLDISKKHRKAKHSFVIVTDKVNLDEMPDDIVIVPTLQEAHDIIEMDEIERDLGF